MASHPAFDPSGLARAAATLASLIPGYSGYKEREHLREEDQAVREAVARRLALIAGRMERVLRRVVRDLPPRQVEEADRALRALGRERDRIRFAPAGYASMFARHKIEQMELETLLALDAGLWASVEELDRVAAGWEEQTRHGEASWPAEDMRSAVFEFEDALDERESFLRS